MTIADFARIAPVTEELAHTMVGVRVIPPVIPAETKAEPVATAPRRSTTTQPLPEIKGVNRSFLAG